MCIINMKKLGEKKEIESIFLMTIIELPITTYKVIRIFGYFNQLK